MTVTQTRAMARLDLVQLRPVDKADIDMLYRWATDPTMAKSWKYRGATPPPDIFAHDMWAGVLAQYVVQRRADSEPIALASIYNANISSGRAHLACLSAPAHVRSGLALLGATALVAHAFETWPLRKLYLETTSAAIETFEAIMRSGLVREEARLVDYEQFGTERADLIYLSIDRQPFLDALAELAPQSRSAPMTFQVNGLRLTSDPDGAGT